MWKSFQNYVLTIPVHPQVIGRLELGAVGAGSARHHWREVQAAPRRQIADWHKLKE